jgi:hypothetical protein
MRNRDQSRSIYLQDASTFSGSGTSRARSASGCPLAIVAILASLNARATSSSRRDASLS